MDSLPSGQSIRTVFLPDGTEVAEYSGSDFGNQPDWDKRVLVGAGLVIRGLSTETFHQDGSAFPPARSVLYNVVDVMFGDEGRYTDPPETEAWGMFFSEGNAQTKRSIILDQIESEFRKNGNRPFLTSIAWVETQPATKNAPARGYYKLARYVRNATETSPKSETPT
jgi:hypothetical protein